MKAFLFATAFAAVFATPARADDPWENVSPKLWLRDFSGSPRDGAIPLPTSSLDQEGIGTHYPVFGLFEHWDLNAKATGSRSHQYADITRECKGKIETDFALTAEEWNDPLEKARHFRDLDALVSKVGATLLADFHESPAPNDRARLLLAFHALAWQETQWEHYIRYKDWFFVVLSGGSYNKLEDWGLTQVARSSTDPAHLLNRNFFAAKGYCSLSSTIYYGLLEFFFHYREAKGAACNGGDFGQILLGAYNQYSSGVSLCHDGFSSDPKLADYQHRALAGFQRASDQHPWLP